MDNAIRSAGLLDKRKRRREKQYDSGELLSYLTEFEKEYGRSPTERDFNNSHEYPHYDTFKTRFGNWNNALELVELDVESMIRKGVLITNQQKARLWELIILEYLGQNAIDLSGKNCASPIDGICPNGKTYDAKSSGLIDEEYFSFNCHNKEKEEIEVFYLERSTKISQI